MRRERRPPAVAHRHPEAGHFALSQGVASIANHGGASPLSTTSPLTERCWGFGGEIAALIAERGLTSLLAPIARVAGYDTVVPLPRLEQSYMPSVARIAESVRRVCRFSLSRKSPQKVLLPDLREGREEADIVAWHVVHRDNGVADQPLDLGKFDQRPTDLHEIASATANQIPVRMSANRTTAHLQSIGHIVPTVAQRCRPQSQCNGRPKSTLLQCSSHD
jgi:hypothetical protein